MDNVMARHWFIVAKPGSYCGCLDSRFPVQVLCGAQSFHWGTKSQVLTPLKIIM